MLDKLPDLIKKDSSVADRNIDYPAFIRKDLERMLTSPSQEIIDRMIRLHKSMCSLTDYLPIFVLDTMYKTARITETCVEKFVALGEQDAKAFAGVCAFVFTIGQYYQDNPIKPVSKKAPVDYRASMRALYDAMLDRLKAGELSNLKKAFEKNARVFEKYIFMEGRINN